MRRTAAPPSLRSLALAVAVGLLLPALVRSAPPSVTYLYPSGAQAGTTVEVTAAGSFERWPVGAWASCPGVAVKAGKTRGKLTVKVGADVPPGVCWIRLHDEQGASDLRPFLIGTLPEVLEREPNDAPTSAQTLPASRVTINGRLEKAGDVDVFALELRKGQTLVAAVEANRVLKSPMDPVLQVVSADGFVLEQNDDHRGFDPQVVFTAPRDGRYLVRTFAFPAKADSGIRFAGADTFVYRLTVTTGGFAEHAFPLAVSRAAPGEVEAVGWNIPPAARRLPVRPLPGGDLGAAFHPQLAGPVLVRLEPHPALVEQEPNDRRQPQRVELPVTVSGRLARPGETDVYEFRLKKGQQLPIVIEARGLESPLDPVLRLTDAAGKLVNQAQGPARRLGTDPELAVTATADTTYRLEVSDLHGDGGPRFVYVLRLAPARPDFALSVAADRFAAVPGKPLDLPVTVDRRNGFKGEVEVSAIGLPKGITAAPVRVAAGARSATLRLTGEGVLAAGAFRIEGKTRSPELVRVARGPASEVSAIAENLWLTVSKTATVAPPARKKKRR